LEPAHHFFGVVRLEMIRLMVDFDECHRIIIVGKGPDLSKRILDVEGILIDHDKVVVAEPIGQFHAAIEEKLFNLIARRVIIALKPSDNSVWKLGG